MRCNARLRKRRFTRPGCLPLMRSLRQHPAESSQGALRHPGFGLSASTPRLHPRRLPSRLTSRSSRRRVVASLKLLGMRAILAPIRRVRRGLTPALGGRKTFVFRRRFASLFNGPTHCRVFTVLNYFALFFRQSCIASERFGARSNFAGITCVGIGNAGWLSVSLSAPDAVASETPGRVRRTRSGLTASSFGSVCRVHTSLASPAA